MEHHAQLQARISSLGELRDLVRMMRGLAATRLQQAQDALVGIQRYVEIIDRTIARAAVLLELDRHLENPGTAPAGGDALIMVASEHGFVGGFNDRLVERVEKLAAPGRTLGVIGRRARTLMEERGLAVDWSLPMATHVDGVISITRRVADYLVDVTGADILFGRYTGSGSYEIEQRRILPLDPALLRGTDEGPLPLHQLPPTVLIEYLAREYLFAEISRAVTESMATENAIRLRVMESAGEGIDTKVEALTRQEQNLRQEEITTELLDVVTGANAVLGDGWSG